MKQNFRRSIQSMFKKGEIEKTLSGEANCGAREREVNEPANRATEGELGLIY